MRTSDKPTSRRAFIRGNWVSESALAAPSSSNVEIVSLIVNAWPKHLAAVEADIIALGNVALSNVEIHARDALRGKLIVVLEAASPAEIGAMANDISGLPHVLSSVMVFQGSDDGQKVS